MACLKQPDLLMGDPRKGKWNTRSQGNKIFYIDKELNPSMYLYPATVCLFRFYISLLLPTPTPKIKGGQGGERDRR